MYDTVTSIRGKGQYVSPLVIGRGINIPTGSLVPMPFPSSLEYNVQMIYSVWTYRRIVDAKEVMRTRRARL